MAVLDNYFISLHIVIEHLANCSLLPCNHSEYGVKFCHIAAPIKAYCSYLASFNPIPTIVTEKRAIVGKAFDPNADGIIPRRLPYCR